MSRGYPSDWDSRRKAVYQRDNFTCQNCGRRGGPYGDYELHAHHIVPKSKGGTHRKSNLKTLCKQCHNAIHGNESAPTGVGYNGSSAHDANSISIKKEIVQAINELTIKFPITMTIVGIFNASLILYILIVNLISRFNRPNITLFSVSTFLLFSIYVGAAYADGIRSIEDYREFMRNSDT